MGKLHVEKNSPAVCDALGFSSIMLSEYFLRKVSLKLLNCQYAVILLTRGWFLKGVMNSIPGINVPLVVTVSASVDSYLILSSVCSFPCLSSKASFSLFFPLHRLLCKTAFWG